MYCIIATNSADLYYGLSVGGEGGGRGGAEKNQTRDLESGGWGGRMVGNDLLSHVETTYYHRCWWT
jgi:hypothetical protein